MKKSKFDIIYENIMSKISESVITEESNAFTVELDWHDEKNPKSYEEAAKKFGIEVTNVQENGPAGGNPIITFKGEKDKLEALVKEFDPDNILTIEIKPVQE